MREMIRDIDILQKISQMVKSAKQDGFELT